MGVRVDVATDSVVGVAVLAVAIKVKEVRLSRPDGSLERLKLSNLQSRCPVEGSKGGLFDSYLSLSCSKYGLLAGVFALEITQCDGLRPDSHTAG